MDKNILLRKWRWLAPLGLTLIGFGASLLGEAIILKASNHGFWDWFVSGTVALVVLNAGVAVFGEAVKTRALYEWSQHEQPSEQQPE
jgi:hypothetical protein